MSLQASLSFQGLFWLILYVILIELVGLCIRTYQKRAFHFRPYLCNIVFTGLQNRIKACTTHIHEKRCKLDSIVICIMCGYVKGAYAIIICNGFSKDQSGRSTHNLTMKIKSYFGAYVTHVFQFIRFYIGLFMCLHL